MLTTKRRADSGLFTTTMADESVGTNHMPTQAHAEGHSHQVERPASPIRPRQSWQKGRTHYDRMVLIGGLCMALVLCGLLWWFGAYFTLQWVAGVGVALAGWGVLAYTIPAAITLLEIGLWPARTPNTVARVFWFAVVAFDAFTSAAGVHLVATDRGMDAMTAWGIGIVLGIGFALAPEKAARSLVGTLREAMA